MNMYESLFGLRIHPPQSITYQCYHMVKSPAFGVHRWETCDLPTHAWETDDGNRPELPVDGRCAATNPTVAAECFVQDLLSLYFASAISAEKFATLCWYAGCAGMPRCVSKYGKRPGATSGHYQRFLDTRLGIKNLRRKFYNLRVQGHRKHDTERTEFTIPMVPPHETLAEELDADRGTVSKLHAAIDSGCLPASYHRHPVVAANSRVIPISLYTDAVPYTRTDSVVGFWAINMLSHKRHLIGLVRKRVCCKCGCKHWCTFYHVLSFLHWSIRCLAEGCWPSKRHDDTDFAQGDDSRSERAGQRMKFRCAVVHLKGDWSEFCERMGFPTWASCTRPCFLCAGSGDGLFTTIGVSALSLPWHCNRDSEYDEACRRCEIWVTVQNAAQRDLIKENLHYDRRKHSGLRGRCLVKSIPELNLEARDRLEPCKSNPDIGKGFDTMSNFPRTVLFWRVEEETICLHRCPLFDADLGITPVGSIALDLLHMMHLGVLNSFSCMLAWFLISCGIWAQHEMTETEREAIAVLAMRAELWQWYQERCKQKPGELLTKPVDLTPKMLGSAGDQKLRLRGSETWTFFLFILEMCKKYKHKIGDTGTRLLLAGQNLERMLLAIKARKGTQPTINDVQDLAGFGVI